MTNSQHSWDGKQLTGTISGFSAYTTTDSDTGKPVETITPYDLLKMIKEVKAFLSLPELESINKVLYAHATAKGNPHNTQLADYPDDVADALYQEFKKQGGTCTLRGNSHNAYGALRKNTFKRCSGCFMSHRLRK